MSPLFFPPNVEILEPSLASTKHGGEMEMDFPLRWESPSTQGRWGRSVTVLIGSFCVGAQSVSAAFGKAKSVPRTLAKR